MLSAPRSDSSNNLGHGTPAAATSAGPSQISLKLFPGQRHSAADDQIAGTTLGHFEILSRIGAGGMGTVFLANDEKLQRQVALKVLSPQQTSDPASVQRFQNEARAAARLDHDHIARVFFYGDDQDLHYIAYEYVQGPNLRELIHSKGRIEPAVVVGYGVQLAAALCHMSASGVVHRDIKPSNIIITLAGKAKLVDLGLARKESVEESAQLTVAGTTLGTFDYISPEQAKDPRNVDVRSDIYSLGCTLYHALTGEAPFPEGTVLQRLLDHQGKEPPDPAIKNRRVSPALSAIVRKMMAADPRRRYPSAEALLHDLLVAGAAMGLRLLPEGAPSFPDLARSRYGWWSQNASWIATAATLVVAAVAWQISPQFLGSATAETTADFPTSPTATVLPETPRLTAVRPLVTPELVAPEEALTAIPDRAGDIVEPDTASPFRRVEAPPTEAAADPAASIGKTAADLAPSGSTIFDRTLSVLFPNATDPLLPDALTPIAMPAETADGRDVATGRTAPNLPEASSRNGAANSPTTPSTEAGNPTAASVALAPIGSGTSKPAVLPAASATPFAVVGTGKSFASLEAACADIRDQGVIELQFDGRLAEPERPLRLVDKVITIQAARGRKPVLWFAPRNSVADPSQTRMITVAGGSLSLVNVALELQIRQSAVVDLWTLFRLERPERLRLQNTHVTIVNPSHVAAAVIECAPSAMSTFTKMGAMKDSLPANTTEVFIDQSLIRGEATGVNLRATNPVRCELRQTMVALSEWLMQTSTDADAMSSSARVSLVLENTSCLLGQGLLRSLSGDDLLDRQLPIDITARNNVFACGTGTPLIEQEFAQEAMENNKSLTWSGDRNHFDAIETMRLVRFRMPPQENRWTYDAWRSYLGTGDISGSQNTAVAWSRPWRQAEWSRIAPEDARTVPAVDSSPMASVLDMPHVGVAWDRLPSVSAPEIRPIP